MTAVRNSHGVISAFTIPILLNISQCPHELTQHHRNTVTYLRHLPPLNPTLLRPGYISPHLPHLTPHRAHSCNLPRDAPPARLTTHPHPLPDISPSASFNVTSHARILHFELRSLYAIRQQRAHCPQTGKDLKIRDTPDAAEHCALERGSEWEGGRLDGPRRWARGRGF